MAACLTIRGWRRRWRSLSGLKRRTVQSATSVTRIIVPGTAMPISGWPYLPNEVGCAYPQLANRRADRSTPVTGDLAASGAGDGSSTMCARAHAALLLRHTRDEFCGVDQHSFFHFYLFSEPDRDIPLNWMLSAPAVAASQGAARQSRQRVGACMPQDGACRRQHLRF